MDRYIFKQPKLAYFQTPVQHTIPSQMYGSNSEQKSVIVEHPRHYISGIENAEFVPFNINQPYLQPHLNPPQPLQRPLVEAQVITTYSGNNVSFTNRENTQDLTPRMDIFGTYLNHDFIGPERNTIRSFTPQIVTTGASHVSKHTNEGSVFTDEHSKSNKGASLAFAPKQIEKVSGTYAEYIKPSTSTTTMNKNNEINQDKTMTKADKLRILHRSGPRTFSGPVEKILKWHKVLQGIGVFAFYEVVAKCLNIRAGEGCKQLLVRDEGGPAIQIMYYEIDFLLPELHPPCMIRVVGKVMPGSSRLQAYSVRLATGDDIAALPRRAAVADHHIAKLCKEFGDLKNE